MRGKRCAKFQSEVQSRITPAYAGKTRKHKQEKHESQDHPRVCGENYRNVAENVFGMGSPPRMRGKHVKSSLICRCRRITPAYAGKTIATANKPQL